MFCIIHVRRRLYVRTICIVIGKKGILRTPIFILWLEPFAIAGHLVYINPANSPNLDNILGKDTMLYKHNIIPSSEYISRGETEFISRDAGCNGAYAHYSGNDVILFVGYISNYQ